MKFAVGETVQLKFDSLIDPAIMTGGRARLRPIEAGEQTQFAAGTKARIVDLMDAKSVSPNMGVLHPVVEVAPDAPWAVVACYDVDKS